MMLRVIGKVLSILGGFPFMRFSIEFKQLPSAATDIDIDLGHDCNFVFHCARVAGYSGASVARWRFGGAALDTGNNYGAVASEPNDATSTSTINTSGILVGETGQTTPRALLAAITVKERAADIAKTVGIGIDDSESIGTALLMTQHGGLWGNTANLIRHVGLNSGAAVNLNAGSWVLAFGLRFPIPTL